MSAVEVLEHCCPLPSRLTSTLRWVEEARLRYRYLTSLPEPTLRRSDANRAARNLGWLEGWLRLGGWEDPLTLTCSTP